MSSNKFSKKALTKVGISTAIITTAVAGYATVQAAESNTDNSTTDTPSLVQQATPIAPPAGAPPFGGGRGGHGHGGGDEHNQTLSENAYDPEALVEIGEDGTIESDSLSENDAEATPEAPNEDAIYLDGQYIGDSFRADHWGNMQVVVVVENGELTQILIADYPRSTDLSDVISRNAMPTLIEEAIEAQDADIDMVSGATDTSRAFVQSLESALEDALIIQNSAESANA